MQSSIIIDLGSEVSGSIICLKKYNLNKCSYLLGHINLWGKIYLFRTPFTVMVLEKGQIFNLIFKAINYRASLWLNGIQIADFNHMGEMFSEYCFNATQFIEAGKKIKAIVLKEIITGKYFFCLDGLNVKQIIVN